jgi:DhnA family fructose-bisphosphate aldolase class Ia
MDNREIKMQRLFSRGNAVIIACDHGEFDGPIPGMVDIRKTVSKINPDVDGILMSPGMLRHTGEYFARRNMPLAVTRLNWDTVYCFHWNYSEAPAVEAFSPEEMVSLGGEVALVSLTLKTGSESTDAKNVGVFRKLTAAAHKLGIPVIGEYFPTKSDKISPEDMHDEVRIGCRIMAELGADMIKTFYTHDFKKVVAGCPIPIFALGASRLPTQMDALKLAYSEIKDGAKGVVFGRNAIQVANPAKFQSALIDVVKNKTAPETAAKKHKLKE